MIKKLKHRIRIKFLDWRYYYAKKKAIQALETGKYRKRVFVIIDPHNRLVVVDRYAFRSLKSLKSLDRSLLMGDLRRNSVFYYPAYQSDENYEDSMANKKIRYMKHFMGE